MLRRSQGRTGTRHNGGRRHHGRTRNGKLITVHTALTRHFKHINHLHRDQRDMNTNITHNIIQATQTIITVIQVTVGVINTWILGLLQAITSQPTTRTPVQGGYRRSYPLRLPTVKGVVLRSTHIPSSLAVPVVSIRVKQSPTATLDRPHFARVVN